MRGLRIARVVARPILLLGALLFLGASPATAGPRRAVVVNRVALSGAEVQALEGYLKAEIRPGRYWYDRMSGAWGREGRPIQGALPAGIPVKGQLWRQASGGHTGVIVNGRELTRGEVQQLVGAGIPVQQGRWWLNHRGVGGPEGGPAMFDLSRYARRGAATGDGRRGALSSWDLTGVRVYP